MTWKTHALVGANAAWIAVFFSDVHAVLLLLIAGAFGGLLPDIDAGTAKIHFIGKGVLGFARGIFQHRGFFHSLLATSILFIIAVLTLTDMNPLLPFALSIGYLSHLTIDACNVGGVHFFYPLHWEIHFLPRALRTPVQGIADQLLFIIGFTGVATLLFQLFVAGVFDVVI